MKKSILLLSLLVVLLSSCQNESGQSSSGSQTEAKAIAPESVKLVCEAVSDPNMQADAPRHQVFLVAGEKKTKVADILNCNTLGKDQYSQYQIPENALDAVLGWWAGAGDLIYVVQEDGTFVVKQGYVAEESETNDFGYKTVLKVE